MSSFIYRILGGSPELAVETPTKFELVINLDATKALGLTLLESFLLPCAPTRRSKFGAPRRAIPFARR